MSDAWVTVIVLSATAALLRASGPVALGGRELPAPLAAMVPYLAPALLAALVVSGTVGSADGLEIDERLAGVGVAAAVLARRPDALLAAIGAAAAVTASLRLLA